METVSGHTFTCNNKYYLFDYRNLLILEIDRRTYQILNMDVPSLIRYDPILDDFLQKNLFVDDVLNQFIELDSEIAYLSIPTIHSCNMRCRYCFAEAGQKYKGEQRNIAPELLNDIIDFFVLKYSKVTKYRIDFVSGGEPLLNFDIVKYTNDKVKKIEKQEVMIWLATNGLLLSDTNVKYMDDNNIQFGVSIDGTKETHDINRIDVNGEGTFDRIISNIKAIKNNKQYTRNTRDIWILTTITTQTKSLVDIIKTYEVLGLKRIQVRIVRTEKESHLGLDRSSVDHFVNLYKDLIWYFKDEISKSHLESIKMIMNRNDMLGKIIISLLLREPCITRCMAGRDKISVTAEGDIYPCESFIGEDQFCLGNIYEKQDVDNIFKQINVYFQEKCRDCWAKYICGGGCYYRNYIDTGHVDSPDESYCCFYRKLVEMTIDLVAFINQNDVIGEELECVAKGKIKMEW